MLFPLFLAFFCVNIASAKTFTYLCKGGDVTYSIAKQKEDFFLVVTFSTDETRFMSDPKLLIRTFKNEVISLSGRSIGDGAKSFGVAVGNIVVPISKVVSTAQFPMSIDQLEKLNDGIKKIRIEVSPVNHEKEYKKDKFGAKLFKQYQIMRAQKDEEF